MAINEPTLQTYNESYIYGGEANIIVRHRHLRDKLVVVSWFVSDSWIECFFSRIDIFGPEFLVNEGTNLCQIQFLRSCCKFFRIGNVEDIDTDIKWNWRIQPSFIGFCSIFQY